MKNVLIGGVLAGLLGGVVACQQPPPPAAGTGSQGTDNLMVGRYQIVNGTPQLSINIMLLDTVTGDSWIKCSSKSVGDLWCKMPRSDSSTDPAGQK